MNRSELLEKYISKYTELKTLLAGFPEEAFHFKPAPGKWSIHEVVIHLTDTETFHFIRARKFIAEPGSELPAFKQNEWTEKLLYGKQNIDEALELFRFLRITTYNLLKKQPEGTWQNKCIHHRLGEITMLQWLGTNLEHCDIHIEQIKKNLSIYKKQ